MSNLFGEVYVPALNLTLDVLIPVHVTIRQAIALIVEIIQKKEQISLDPGSLSLYDPAQQAFLAEEETLGLAPVQDACYLIMI